MTLGAAVRIMKLELKDTDIVVVGSTDLGGRQGIILDRAVGPCAGLTRTFGLDSQWTDEDVKKMAREALQHFSDATHAGDFGGGQ